MSIPIAMIAAVAKNGVIGGDQTIPWHIPSDFAWFKRMTLGKPLPGRTNIVVTRQDGYQPQGVVVVASLDAALDAARDIAERDGADEIVIIGGGDIYAQMMGRADRLYISHIDLAPQGDVEFPPIDPTIWEVAEQPEVTPNPRDEASYRINVYKRRNAAAH